MLEWAHPPLSIIISLLYLPTLKGPAEYSGILASFHPALFILARYHFMIFLSFVMLESLRSCPLTFGKHHQLTTTIDPFSFQSDYHALESVFLSFLPPSSLLLRIENIMLHVFLSFFIYLSCFYSFLPFLSRPSYILSCAYQQTHYFMVLTLKGPAKYNSVLTSFFADQDYYAQPLCYFLPHVFISQTIPFSFMTSLFFTSVKCHYSLLTTVYQR